MSIIPEHPARPRYVDPIAELRAENQNLRTQLADATRKLEEASKDAERYRFLRDLHCNQFSVSYNDGHASNYMTAKEWIEEAMPDWFINDPVEEVEKMKSTNSIWTLQVYPNTPIGFNVWNASTLDAVIDQAIEQGKGGSES